MVGGGLTREHLCIDQTKGSERQQRYDYLGCKRSRIKIRELDVVNDFSK